jgi:hypothetical protein
MHHPWTHIFFVLLVAVSVTMVRAQDDATTALPPSAKHILTAYEEAIARADAAFREAVAKEQAKAIKALDAELIVQTHRGDLDQSVAITAKIAAMKMVSLNPPILDPHWQVRTATKGYRYIGEFSDKLFDAQDATAPNELTMVMDGRNIAITGTKVIDTLTINGKLSGHFGKAFKTTLTNVRCRFEIRQAYRDNHTNYEFLVVAADDSVESTVLHPAVGTVYFITVVNDSFTTTWTLDDGTATNVLGIRKSANVSGWGMASTVRMIGDCSDLEVSIEPR